MPSNRIQINRAPVLTLWATIVAERLGYDRNSALTLGKAVASLNALAKGQRLGIFQKPQERPLKVQRKAEKPKEEEAILLLGRLIPIMRSKEGVRAKLMDEAVDPKDVEKYLTQKFGDDLGEVQAAMKELAKAHKPDDLANKAYALYEKFRPSIPEGEKGWGWKGELDLNQIRSLAKRGN